MDNTIHKSPVGFFKEITICVLRNTKNRKIQKEVTKSRNHEDWRSGYMFMWEIKEEGRAEGLQEGRTEGQALALSNVKKKKICSKSIHL